MRFATLPGSKGIASRAGLLRLLIVLAVAGAGFGVWRVTQATGPTTMAISPASRILLYYNRTPFTETLNLSNGTNVGAYQFRLTWNPNKLQWVGSDMATVTWLASTGRGPLCAQIYDLTSTPTGTLPTFTPTNTPAVPTATFTATPTPAGNISFGCATIGTPGQVGLPPGPSVGGTPVALAHFTFMSNGNVETSDQVKLTNLAVTDVLGTPAAVVSSNGSVGLVGCHDMDGDHIISILDLARVAAHFGATPTVPVPPGWTWVPLYDVDSDSHISILDLAKIAAAFGFPCA